MTANTVNVTLHCPRCFTHNVKTDGKEIKCQDKDCGYLETKERFIELCAEINPFKPVQVNVKILPEQKGVLS